MTTLEKLVIFDYSGTLSLEAPRFARRENLVGALAETGLAALGIATPELFWDEIVNPTWVEGSTTQVGYKKVMAGRIAVLGLATGIPEGRIEAAASRFVERYLAESRIDPHWRPILSYLVARRDAGLIIATDHYAEATEAIIGFLRAWDTPAFRVGEAEALSPLFVANSADLGAWKEDRRFWESVKRELSLGVPRLIILIDDFGFNEQAGDRYGERAAISLRQERTTALLQEVFKTAAEVIPFRLEEDPRAPEDAAARLIAETAARIDILLTMEAES
ncbi:MAG: hypothetical protein KJ936_01190 [Proteobacteria bacterium]|nr:hypothetical protein [Pseudomonadota bacterium]MBU2226282.1 hypothetical protein [Pseudomonadota bacterium]MBU2261500.1 hypothetical protein [Pseudomonadota bacterium]